VHSGNAGFTLVEVIVVSVIVAVLCVAAILLYRAYAIEARQNVVENVAASAAGFLNAAVNTDKDAADAFDDLPGAGQWVHQLPSGAASVFRAPANVEIRIDKAAKTVSAELRGTVSQSYGYDQ
jgi:prepilin-type N-terminal cleavage/methylation domain-containing protein